MSSLGDAAEDVELEQVLVKVDTSDFDTGTTITTTTPPLLNRHLDVSSLGDADEGVELEQVLVDLDALVAEELVTLPALERGQNIILRRFPFLRAHGALWVRLAQVQAYDLRREDEVGLKG